MTIPAYGPAQIPGSDVEKFYEGIHFVSPGSDRTTIIPMQREGAEPMTLVSGKKYRFIFNAPVEETLPPKEEEPTT